MYFKDIIADISYHDYCCCNIHSLSVIVSYHIITVPPLHNIVVMIPQLSNYKLGKIGTCTIALFATILIKCHRNIYLSNTSILHFNYPGEGYRIVSRIIYWPLLNRYSSDEAGKWTVEILSSFCIHWTTYQPLFVNQLISVRGCIVKFNFKTSFRSAI